MSLENKTVLVTGASRGIGAATVKALLSAGAGKVYATARNLGSLPDFGDSRVSALQLDTSSDTSVADAAAAASDIDVLINNAGTMGFSDFIGTTVDAVQADMDTNYYGTLRVIRGFLPVLSAKPNSTIVNVVSVLGLGPVPSVGAYSASKAALHALTQSLRGSLAANGIVVLGAYPGPIETELSKNLPVPKATADLAAHNIVRGIEAGELYIFPDPTAVQIGQLWSTNAKAVEVALR